MKVDLEKAAKRRASTSAALSARTRRRPRRSPTCRARREVKKVGSEKVRRLADDALPRGRRPPAGARRASGCRARDALEKRSSTRLARRAPVDVWVDERGIRAQDARSYRPQVAVRTSRRRSAMEMHDFGSPVTIAAPAADERDRLRAVAAPRSGASEHMDVALKIWRFDPESGERALREYEVDAPGVGLPARRPRPDQGQARRDARLPQELPHDDLRLLRDADGRARGARLQGADEADRRRGPCPRDLARWGTCPS